MELMFKKIFLTLFLILFSSSVFSKPLKLIGLSKLSLDDIQSITSIDIYNNNLEINDVNIIIKDLSLSDLIFDVEFTELNDHFQFSIAESDLIENIFINNNIWIKDDLIIQNLSSKNNLFLTNNKIKKDINIIKNIYKSKGFLNISVLAKVERYSQDRVNLIYEINEKEQQKINIIKFTGNNFFSNNYLNSIINSQSIKFYNFFKSGSNLNYSTFEFDKNQIISAYKDEGFTNVKVSYDIQKTSLSNNILNFYIDEGERTLIKNLIFKFEDEFISNLFNKPILDFKDKIKKNNFYYKQKLIEEITESLNSILTSNNIHNKLLDISFDYDLNDIDIYFSINKINPVVINKINIIGNSITKNDTIRSKISVEPGQYLNKYNLTSSINNLKRYPYIKDVKSDTSINNQLADITINVDEETKTGNILLAGTFNSDTGVGITLGLEDKNIFGSGNSLSSNFIVNSEDLKFDINYIQYPILNPNLTNTYTLFNQDYDFSNTFGYKASRRGLGYFVNFKQNDEYSYGVGLNYETFKGHSAVNTSSLAISDNIGNFENFNLNFSIKYDSTNDFFNPTDGIINELGLTFSPNEISDNPFFKFTITNNNYRKFEKSTNYLFLNNNYGYAKSLNGKLKTINAFSLGGMNFKGFDYKGIGPYDGNIYLGGNEYFTSTIGYGSSFIFDDKDNINVKFFITTGSIWNSDYTDSSDLDLRTSVGTSFDFITPVGPISFSYASPIEKLNSDKTRVFNFSIGTSF